MINSDEKKPTGSNGVLDDLATSAQDVSCESHAGEAAAMSAANLEKRLQDEIDKRLEERFIFALILVVLFDVHYLLEADNFTGPLIVGLLQLVGLILFARRCGIEEIDRLVDKAVNTFKRSGE